MKSEGDLYLSLSLSLSLSLPPSTSRCSPLFLKKQKLCVSCVWIVQKAMLYLHLRQPTRTSRVNHLQPQAHSATITNSIYDTNVLVFDFNREMKMSEHSIWWTAKLHISSVDWNNSYTVWDNLYWVLQCVQDCIDRIYNSLVPTLHPAFQRCMKKISVCNIEKLRVAWVRG